MKVVAQKDLKDIFVSDLRLRREHSRKVILIRDYIKKFGNVVACYAVEFLEDIEEKEAEKGGRFRYGFDPQDKREVTKSLDSSILEFKVPKDRSFKGLMPDVSYFGRLKRCHLSESWSESEYYDEGVDINEVVLPIETVVLNAVFDDHPLYESYNGTILGAGAKRDSEGRYLYLLNLSLCIPASWIINEYKGIYEDGTSKVFYLRKEIPRTIEGWKGILFWGYSIPTTLVRDQSLLRKLTLVGGRSVGEIEERDFNVYQKSRTILKFPKEAVASNL